MTISRSIAAGFLITLLLGGCGSPTPPASSPKDRNDGTGKTTSDNSEVESEGRSIAEGSAPVSGACGTPADTVPVTTASAELPTGVRIPEGATVTGVAAGQVTGFAPGDVSDLLSAFRKQLDQTGAKITGADNEGREAEVRFDTAGGDKGEVRLNRSTCTPGTTNFVILTHV